MKTHTTLILLLSSLVMFTQAEVKQAKSISPSDLGAHKWVISGTAKKDEVVVIRLETIRVRGGKEDVDIYDTVHYNPGEKVEGTVFAIDPNYFNPQGDDDPKWHLSALGNSAWVTGRYNGSSTSGNHGMIKFKRKNGFTYEYKFKSFVMSLGKAKEVYDGLPVSVKMIAWTWAGSPKK